jgi:preprotein translocase subunit SecG
MTTLNTIILIVHVLVGAMIIGLVLIQRGKGAEAGAAFGAGASGTVFGARGSANFLSRSTAILAAVFFLTSLSLTYLGTQQPAPKSILNAAPVPTLPASLPAVPGVGGQPGAVPGDGNTTPALPPLPAPPGPGQQTGK